MKHLITKLCIQFSKKSILEAYTGFVGNVKRADNAIRNDVNLVEWRV